MYYISYPKNGNLSPILTVQSQKINDKHLYWFNLLNEDIK